MGEKETYFYKKFCVALWNEMEWLELVQGGFNTLVGTDSERITKARKFSLIIEMTGNLYGNRDDFHNINENLKITL